MASVIKLNIRQVKQVKQVKSLARPSILGAALSLVVSMTLSSGAPVPAASAAPAVTQLVTSPVAGEITTAMGSGTGCMANESGIDGSANPIMLSSCNNTVGQQLWVAEPDSSIRVYLSYHSDTGAGDNMWCLLVTNNALDGGYAVETWACNGTDGETWNPDGTDQLESPAHGDVCLSSENGTSGDQLIATACSSSSYQQWTLPTSTSVSQEASGILNLQSDYDVSSDSGNGLFVNTSECTTNSGNCWWWSANALYSIIDFSEQAGSSWSAQRSDPDGQTDLASSDIDATYEAICDQGTGGANQCPTNELSSGNETNPNSFRNNWFDDTGNWALTWLSAYEYEKSLYGTCGNVPAGQPCFDRYKYLAENLWYYITHSGWDSNDNATAGWPFTNSCKEAVSTTNNYGGIFQQKAVNDSGNFKNLGANSLYLRLSSWLYLATGENSLYFNGEPGNSGTYGGVAQEANWLIGTGSSSPSTLVQEYNGSSFPDYPLFLKGEVAPTSDPGSACTAADGQKQTQHEGMVIGALAEVYKVAEADDTGLVSPPSFYLTVADNIAKTAFNDTIDPDETYPAGEFTNPAMIDSNSIFSEPCTASPSSDWPDACVIAGSSAWLPGKGIFVRNLYCLNQAPVQSGTIGTGDITSFVETNAQSVWNEDQSLTSDNSDNLNEFGFLWDGAQLGFSWGTDGSELSFATQLAALEALSANLGVSASTPVYTMC